MQFATLSSSFCPFQPCQPTKREDLFVLLEGKTPKISFHIWLSAKRRGSTPIPDSKLVSKKCFKGPIQWITVPTCTYHLIFMFNLLVPEALADIIDEKGTMGEQSLNNCRQESCVVRFFSWSSFCTSGCWQCAQYGILILSCSHRIGPAQFCTKRLFREGSFWVPPTGSPHNTLLGSWEKSSLYANAKLSAVEQNPPWAGQQNNPPFYCGIVLSTNRKPA